MSAEPVHVSQEYLDTVAARFRADKEHAYRHLALREGASVLDVGCGPATDTLALASLVGPTGWVVGVDRDAAMVAEANDRAASAGVADRVIHQVGEVENMSFPDGAFDATHSERVFQHLERPREALSEMIRVTRSQGRVVVADTDWASISIDVTDSALERRLVRFMGEGMHRQPYIGRQLFRLFVEAGLRDVSLEPRLVVVHNVGFLRLVIGLDDVEHRPVEEGIASDGEIDRWRADLEEADAAGRLYGCGLINVVSGTVP